ncbi:DNA replication complex GINS family protein [Candidatus Woesearchaeota archaeon]|nr:DNA replication complex GINS family protein [Candidatus Woesearchaeota archaeon]
MQGEVNITYETLFEILRREKNREELQTLTKTFLEDVKNYLQTKKNVATKNQEQNTLFSKDDTDNTLKQLTNTNKILSELYDRRERKIMILALNKAKTQSNIVNTTALLEHEKTLYADMVRLLESNRTQLEQTLNNVNTSTTQPVTQVEQTTPEPTSTMIQEPQVEKTSQLTTIMVRFLQPVPQFVGEDLENYGPFEEDDMANLPRDVANVLLTKERAETVEQK